MTKSDPTLGRQPSTTTFWAIPATPSSICSGKLCAELTGYGI